MCLAAAAAVQPPACREAGRRGQEQPSLASCALPGPLGDARASAKTLLSRPAATTHSEVGPRCGTTRRHSSPPLRIGHSFASWTRTALARVAAACLRQGCRVSHDGLRHPGRDTVCGHHSGGSYGTPAPVLGPTRAVLLDQSLYAPHAGTAPTQDCTRAGCARVGWQWSWAHSAKMARGALPNKCQPRSAPRPQRKRSGRRQGTSTANG